MAKAYFFKVDTEYGTRYFGGYASPMGKIHYEHTPLNARMFTSDDLEISKEYGRVYNYLKEYGFDFEEMVLEYDIYKHE